MAERKTSSLLSTITRNRLVGTGIAYMRQLLNYIDGCADEIDKIKWRIEKLEKKGGTHQHNKSKKGKQPDESLPSHMDKNQLPIGP